MGLVGAWSGLGPLLFAPVPQVECPLPFLMLASRCGVLVWPISICCSTFSSVLCRWKPGSRDGGSDWSSAAARDFQPRAPPPHGREL
eukprot:602930-Rhodomonas_salina.2